MKETVPRLIRNYAVTFTISLYAVLFAALCARQLFQHGDKHSVFPVFAFAGQSWLHGDDLYVRGGSEEFRYSPLVAAFFVPFSILPTKLGEFAWRSLNFFAFVGGLLYCCQIGVPRKFSTLQICTVFLLSIPLALGSINNGQSNPLVLGLMLISIAAVMQNQWSISAIVICIATCFKLYPIALGLLLVLLFPWRMGWRLVVCLAAAAVLPFLMQRAAYVIDQYSQWVHYLSTEDRQRGPISDWYRDFRAVWRVYVMPMKPMTYLVIEIAAAVLIALLCLAARARKMPRSLLLGFTFSLACCWMTVLGPATESATYILLAPTVAWSLVLSSKRKKFTPLYLGYGIVFGLFVASQLALNFPNGKYFRDHLQPLPVAGLMLLLLVTVECLISLWKREEAQT